MAVCRHLWPPFIPFLLVPLLLPLLASAASELDALLKLKKSFENATSLESWSRDSNPCDEKAQWAGVVCFKGAVTGLRLGSMGLSGKIDLDALLGLPNLRSASFMNNRFTGALPGFNRIGVLKAIYLSGNQFSGEIPSNYFSNMASLKKAWLDGNAFEGTIPPSALKLPRLMELHLENNHFSGKIPLSIDLPMMKSFNVSNNELEGSIPLPLSMFGASAFAGNDGLCGALVGKDCPSKSDVTPVPAEPAAPRQGENKKSTNVALICIVVLLFVLLVVAVVRRSKHKREGNFSNLSRAAREVEEEEVPGPAPAPRRESRHKDSVRKETSVRKCGQRSGGVVSDITLVNEQRGAFGLPDLMKAAAEVLGAGGMGSAYKAVMANGLAVVVKRMRDMDRVGIEGFEAEMRRIGSLRHPNVLPLLAFHSRKEEKLLVYDFAQRGSLLYLLHGNVAVHTTTCSLSFSLHGTGLL